MRTTVVISIGFHIILLLCVHKAFPLNWLSPLRTYHIEFIRPPVDTLFEEIPADAHLAKAKASKNKPPKITEDTISLNTKDKRYVPYARLIKERLMQHWEYPKDAQDNLIEGRVLVIFSLDREGNLISLKILMPSAYAILDNETERTIRASAPFPSFPGSVTVQRLNIKANFAYRLTARRP